MGIVATFLCLATYGFGQSPAKKNAEICLLQLRTGQSAITLTKGPFEGDTVYTLSFRDATRARGQERSTQGFFLTQLKEFATALQTVLATGTVIEVEFGEGTMERTRRRTAGEQIMVTFTTGTGTCLLTRIEAISLISAIKSECRVWPSH